MSTAVSLRVLLSGVHLPTLLFEISVAVMMPMIAVSTMRLGGSLRAAVTVALFGGGQDPGRCARRGAGLIQGGAALWEFDVADGGGVPVLHFEVAEPAGDVAETVHVGLDGEVEIQAAEEFIERGVHGLHPAKRESRVEFAVTVTGCQDSLQTETPR